MTQKDVLPVKHDIGTQTGSRGQTTISSRIFQVENGIAFLTTCSSEAAGQNITGWSRVLPKVFVALTKIRALLNDAFFEVVDSETAFPAFAEQSSSEMMWPLKTQDHDFAVY